MLGLDPLDADDGGTVFRDVIMLALLGFLAIVVMLLPHLHVPAEAGERPPGSLVVEIRWPDAQPTDVDLWVQAPGDTAVGYSNKGGRVFDLLRDDRGNFLDLGALNYEVAYSRARPAGEYTVNLHLYEDRLGQAPVLVEVAIGMRGEDDTGFARIVTRNAVLLRRGHEITVARFSLDVDGALVPGSIHDLPRALRSAVQRGTSGR